MTFSRKRSASRFSTSALALGALLFSAPVFAHAALRHAAPAAGETIDAAADTLTLEFSTDVDLTAVELTLHDAAGKDIDLKAADGDAKSGTIVSRTLKAPLPAGTYEVKWRVLSIDGHHTRGSYTFDVKPSASK